jgi:hypothetical protein
MHCTIMSLAHVWLISSIGHVYAEPELKELTERVQVEDFTNIDLNQGKPRCIYSCSLSFNFKALLYVIFWLCIKFVEVAWYHSYMLIYLPDYP